MSAEYINIVKEIFFRYIKTKIITIDDNTTLLKIIKSIRGTIISEDAVFDSVIKILKEAKVGINSFHKNQITFSFENWESVTINIKKYTNPPGFGSSVKRFGGKRTKKNIKLLQNGGEPNTVVVGFVVSYYLLCCVVWGIQRALLIKSQTPRTICMLPITVAKGIINIPNILEKIYKHVRSEPNTNKNSQPNYADSKYEIISSNIYQPPVDESKNDISVDKNKDSNINQPPAYPNTDPNADSNADSKDSSDLTTLFFEKNNYPTPGYFGKNNYPLTNKYLQEKNQGFHGSDGGKSRSKIRKRKSRRTKK